VPERTWNHCFRDWGTDLQSGSGCNQGTFHNQVVSRTSLSQGLGWVSKSRLGIHLTGDRLLDDQERNAMDLSCTPHATVHGILASAHVEDAIRMSKTHGVIEVMNYNRY